MGSFRAEQFTDELFDLFATPTYWPNLLSPKPCLLVGGRGTGKTTVLRGLSYEGQDRLNGGDITTWALVGLYWRIDSTVVTAFRGAGLTVEEWTPIFGHYVNLSLVRMACDFFVWWEKKGNSITFDKAHLSRAARSLHIRDVGSPVDMLDAVDDAIADFESYINNVRGQSTGNLSMIGRPIQHVFSSIGGDPVLGQKTFAFLIDEYENLEDYQQRVFNTLIRHAGDSPFTFKVGMRETGHRERRTLSQEESVNEPADYTLIDITRRLKDSDFANFAGSICDGRLERIRNRNHSVLTVRELLPELSELEEARRLGVEARLAETRRRLEREGTPIEDLNQFAAMNPMSAYMVGFWSDKESVSLSESLRAALANPREWATRLGNYQHAMLFTIRRGMRGHRKYYAGWDTYVQLADGNIRFLLQLVTEALERHVQEGNDLSGPASFEVQTTAAQEVGRRVVQQLPGVAAEGAQITKLVLGLGRIFQVMAAQPEGHTPEANQFRVSWRSADPTQTAELEDLLGACVMHLAVTRFAGDKMAAASGETRDFDYQLHPIFAPFFAYSHRRKRRITIDVSELLGLTMSESSATIRRVLRRTNRDASAELPEQLSLFRGYFHDASA